MKVKPNKIYPCLFTDGAIFIGKNCIHVAKQKAKLEKTGSSFTLTSCKVMDESLYVLIDNEWYLCNKPCASG